ncbi:MAG: PD40 domain-containing protein [Lentisphaeria bacterium]|nr:PD40 domain-containing protein [Lentisphaeria bacterium]
MRLAKTVMLLFFALTLATQAQVRITGTGKAGNPTVLFRGIKGSNKMLEKKIFNVLRVCGWVDLVQHGKSDMVISGEEMGSRSILLHVANSAGVRMYSVKAAADQNDQLAYAAVDAFLTKEFGVAGLCRTKIVFSAQTGRNQREIYLCDFDGSNIRKLTSNATLSIEPSWHPDGNSIIYNQFLLSSTPLVQFFPGRNQCRALSRHPGINSGRISPDGKKLALILTARTKDKRTQLDLFVRDFQGGPLTRLTNDRAVEASPAWSPDSSSICYVSNKSGRPALYIISIYGGAPRRVPGTLGSESVSPAWSKDHKLAYSAKLGDYQLKVIDLSQAMNYPARKNTADSILADYSAPAVAGESPSWAPDNRHVVVSSRGSIVIVDTRTNKTRTLISGKSKCSGANWSPILD